MQIPFTATAKTIITEIGDEVVDLEFTCSYKLKAWGSFTQIQEIINEHANDCLDCVGVEVCYQTIIEFHRKDDTD